MVRFTRLSATLALGAATLAAACSKDSTAPAAVSDTTIASQDVAAEAGASTATVVNSMTASDAASGAADVASLPSGAFADFSATTTCTGPTDSTSVNPKGAGWYVCSASLENGLNVLRAHRYFGGGTLLAGWGATVDSVQHLWTESGTQVDTGGSATVPVVRTRYVSRGDTASQAIGRGTPQTRTWNSHGFNNDSTVAVDKYGTRHWHYSGSRIATNVVWTLPRSANPYPTSGTVLHTWQTTLINDHASGKVDTTTTTRTVTVTFNGTQQVPIAVGGLTCTLDLKTRQVSACK